MEPDNRQTAETQAKDVNEIMRKYDLESNTRIWDGRPGLIFFDTCPMFFSDLAGIQVSKDDPSDCAKEPHGITHAVDALRYYCVSRKMRAERAEEPIDERAEGEDFELFMTGGEAEEEYIY